MKITQNQMIRETMEIKDIIEMMSELDHEERMKVIHFGQSLVDEKLKMLIDLALKEKIVGRFALVKLKSITRVGKRFPALSFLLGSAIDQKRTGKTGKVITSDDRLLNNAAYIEKVLGIKVSDISEMFDVNHLPAPPSEPIKQASYIG
jgi:hypothetical protein